MSDMWVSLEVRDRRTWIEHWMCVVDRPDQVGEKNNRLYRPCSSLRLFSLCVDRRIVGQGLRCSQCCQERLVNIGLVHHLQSLFKSVESTFWNSQEPTGVKLLELPLSGNHGSIFSFLLFLSNPEVDSRPAIRNFL
jgi:hypothetical protein